MSQTQPPKTNGLQAFNQTLTNEKTQTYLAQVLNDKKNSFVNNMTALVANNANLQQCEPLSLLYAGIKATALDLPLDANLGYAFVIPFKDNKNNTVVATFQISAKGIKTLAIRSGQYKYIHSTDIREGEIANRDRISGLMDFKFVENDAERLKLPIIGYVNSFELLNGFKSMLYMSIEEIKQHAEKYSQTYRNDLKYSSKSSKWSNEDDFGKMCEKTVSKLNLSRNGILSVEMQTAIQADQAVITKDGYRYLDNEADNAPNKAENLSKVSSLISEAEVVGEQSEEENFMKSPTEGLKMPNAKAKSDNQTQTEEPAK